MRRLAVLTLVVVIAVSFLLPVHQADAAQAQKVVKIGDIKSFNGAVLVRTKGVWGRLKKVPHPLFSTDKIVTKRGRAAVAFVDGGVLRVNVDSNVSIVQRTEMKGFFSKRPVTSRIINVLVGDVWFDVKVTRDRRMNFRTPSMTAAIRGTAGQVKAGVDGKSDFGLSRGKADTSGRFDPIKGNAVKDHPVKSVLPRSNPLVQRAPVMKAVDKAVKSHSGAAAAVSEAGGLKRAAKTEAAQALQVKAESALKQAAYKAVDAAVAKAGASVQAVDAQLATAREALIEAKLMGDTEAAMEAEANLKLAEQTEV
jgi:hypothetical protein